MQLVGLINLSAQCPHGASKIVADGELVLKQSKPILIDSIARQLYNVDPLRDTDTTSVDQESMQEIISKYNSRSERVIYEASQLVQPQGSRFSTTLELNVKIPRKQEIIYRPGFLETMKFFWVQYVMVLIPVFYVTNAVLQTLFKYRVFEAIILSDLRQKRKIF